LATSKVRQEQTGCIYDVGKNISGSFAENIFTETGKKKYFFLPVFFDAQNIYTFIRNLPEMWGRRE
jgi:hypothetical protein